MKIPYPKYRLLALSFAALAVVLLQACGLTDDAEPAEAQPPVVAMPPADPADEADWEAE